jgi:chromosomal replication initiation ATPase DnaA
MQRNKMRSIKRGTHRINPEVIKKVMCMANNLDESIFEKKTRKNEVIFVKHTYVYLCRKYSGLGVVPLARLMQRDHTTIVYILDKINFLNGKDDYITELITNFEKTMFHNEQFNFRPTTKENKKEESIFTL